MFALLMPRHWCVVLLSVVAFATSPAPVSACDYGYTPLPKIFDGSTDVFVGTVTQSVFLRGADGQIRVRRGAGFPGDVRFKVLTRYKGAPGDEVVLTEALSGCAYMFVEGATYMVHAFVTNEGHLVSGQAARPILISLPDGSRGDGSDPATLWSPELAIAYADARAHQKPCAFIEGTVFLIGRDFLGRDGVAVSARASDDVVVYAERAGTPATVVRVPNAPWNMFEMVLSPGAYRFRVTRSGVQLGDAVTVSVADGESRMVNLGPGWSR
jgi:hypothetical protein